MNRTWPRWLRWSRDFLLMLLVFQGVQWWYSRNLSGGPAPALSGEDLQGQHLSLTQFRGQPLLVHFWATWCSICRLEEGSIHALAQDYPVVTVATTSGNAQELRGYLQERGLSFSVVADESGDLARGWGVAGVPVSYIIDSQGNIAWAARGYSSGLGLRARLWLTD